MEKVSIRRIAEIAGVSPTTVSYVLNGRPGVSQKTRDRILRVIDQEHYIPNAKSRAAVVHRSFNIFMVVDEIASFSNPFYSTILDAISLIATKYGYNIVVSSKPESFRTSDAARAIKQGNADGVVLLHDPDSETLLYLRQENVPFVVVDSHTKHPSFSRVGVDYELAAYTITKHLMSLGHTRIGFLGQQSVPDFSIANFQGYCRALSEGHLTLYPDWIQSEANDFESALNGTDAILRCNERPTAIFCSSDYFAQACMHCIQKNGFSVPGDFSVVGIDDLHSSSICYPPLTTVHVDYHDIVAKAVEYLDRMIQEQNPALEESYMIKSDDIVVRGSTGEPRAEA